MNHQQKQPVQKYGNQFVICQYVSLGALVGRCFPLVIAKTG